MSASVSLPGPVLLRTDALTIGLVGLAHGTSHFFHLLLPPLFPWLTREFALDYSELGLLVTLFFTISGVGQALAGFVVDRVGARPVLFVALGCFVAAALAAAGATGYSGLMLAAALAGLGNAPFHPVDFTILNKRVSQRRLGHAFSVHGITGNLGWAAAPVFLVGIAAATDSWRIACLAAALLALVVLLVMLARRDLIDDRSARSEDVGPAAVKASDGQALAFLRLPSVWLCFAFFFWVTCALTAVQSFAGPALQRLVGLPLAVTSMVVTGFMLSAAVGMVLGGFLPTRVERLEHVVSAALLFAACLLALAGSGWLGGVGSALAVTVAGLGTGLAGPSRDMLIKSAAPPGATGRVYGTVYSGLDLGFAVAAPVFGALLDAGRAGSIFFGAALVLVIATLLALMLGSHAGAASRVRAL